MLFKSNSRKLNPQTINPVFTDADLSRYNSLLTLSLFHFYDFFDWWYVRMPIQYILHLSRLMQMVNDQFSISLLIKTFFTPWHRDAKFIGYFMGIAMRIIYIPIATVIYLLTFITSLTLIILWILLPMITIIFIIITPIT